MFQMRPICLLYAEDGFDPCVHRNMAQFYRRLGFRVCSSTTRVIDCDLLVVERGNAIRNLPPRKVPVHVYNYSAQDTNALREMLSGYDVTYIAASDKLQEVYGFGSCRIEFPPPVAPELWTRQDWPTQSRRYGVVHIGNRKRLGVERVNHLQKLIAQGHVQAVSFKMKQTENGSEIHDPRADHLEAMIRNQEIDVWGSGWQDVVPAARYHGSISVYNVCSLYARCEVALGIMYPDQREMDTFSGRFWQAPIVGTPLLSEANLWAQKAPGVYVSDMDGEQGQNFDSWKSIDRDSIQRESRLFWADQTEQLARALKPLCKSVMSGVKQASLQIHTGLEPFIARQKYKAFTERVRMSLAGM